MIAGAGSYRTQPISIDPLGNNPHTIAPIPAAMDVTANCEVAVVPQANVLTASNPGFATGASPTGYAQGETLGGSSGPWTVEVVTPTPTTVDDPALEGEMENVILYHLGVNLQGR